MIQKAFSVTQGGNDTAAETDIQTYIQPGITFGAWELMALEFTLSPNIVKAWANADSDLTVQLTKRSLSGAIARIVNFSDTDLIASYNLAMLAQGTPATWVIQPTTFFVNMPPGLIVYSEEIYIQLISTATGQTNVCWGRLHYEPVTLTQAQALAVIASRP